MATHQVKGIGDAVERNLHECKMSEGFIMVCKWKAMKTASLPDMRAAINDLNPRPRPPPPSQSLYLHAELQKFRQEACHQLGA